MKFLLGLSLSVFALSFTTAHGEDSEEPVREFEWPAEVLDDFGSIPIQDGGRVKPLSSYARYKLLQFNGSLKMPLPAWRELGQMKQMMIRMRVARTEEKLQLKPMEWLLDCLFFPRMANAHECFLIETWDVVHALGLSTEGKKKRDRYSYDQLRPARSKMAELASQYDPIEPKKRTPVQGQLLRLYHNVIEFEFLTHYLDFARFPFEPDEKTGLARVLEPLQDPRLAGLLEAMPGVLGHVEELKKNPETIDDAEKEAYTRFLDHLDLTASPAHLLSLFPRFDGDGAWMSPAEVAKDAFDRGTAPAPGHVEMLAQLERLHDTRTDPEAFSTNLGLLRTSVIDRAEAIGDYDKVPLEVSYYKKNLLFWSKFVFIFACILVGFGWISMAFSQRADGSQPPRILRFFSSLTWKSAGVLTVLGVLFLSYAIYERCVIRDRPPISTLYETILFFAACAAIIGLIVEVLTFFRIGLSLAPALGALGLFIASRYEAIDGQDTMPELVAVLDTNFWLALHVTVVTFGYVAGLFAGFAGAIYLGTKLVMAIFKSSHNPTAKLVLRTMGRITYGVLAFGLIFSTVGTILGGIWANDSWGRFWGWDPKENGALLIVLWELAILHARLGGYIREHGVAMGAVAGNIVIAFSWWGVNLLGEGLHSYGFTEHVEGSLNQFYLSQAIILAIGFIAWFVHWMGAKSPTGGSGSGPKQPPTLPPAEATPPSTPEKTTAAS